MNSDVAFENTCDEDARRQDLVDEICGYAVGSWLIWFPNR